MTAAKLLAPGTVVRLKICGHCIEAWITARREYDNRGLKRDPSVHCSHEHLRGIVQPYDMEYSRGIFPVRFDDGIWRMEMAGDVWVVVPDATEEPASTVLKITTSTRARADGDRIRPGKRARTA
jgi:hypothetical protein